MSYTLDDGLRWRAMYEDGMTFEGVALEEGVSTQTVRRWALKAGVTPRAARMPLGTKHRNRADARPGDRSTGRQIEAWTPTHGHRRRRGARRFR